MSCNTVRICYITGIGPEGGVYVCNCNGIRERDARAAIESGASKPAEIFRQCDSAPRCGRCVCDMQRMIEGAQEALRVAAE